MTSIATGLCRTCARRTRLGCIAMEEYIPNNCFAYTEDKDKVKNELEELENSKDRLTRQWLRENCL